MDTRHNQLVLLSKRVKETNDKLSSILKTLGWTREELRQQRQQILFKRQCPFNKQHVVTEKNFKQHYRKCLLKSRHVSTLKQTKPLLSSLYFYKGAKNVVSFVREQGQQTENVDTTVLSRFPKQDYFVEELSPACTTAEKRAEYDAIVEYKKKKRLYKNDDNNMMMDFTMENEDSKKRKKKEGDKSTMVMMDSKRRPKQYRGKMKIMTPTEIQRELINGYMQELNIK